MKNIYFVLVSVLFNVSLYSQNSVWSKVSTLSVSNSSTISMLNDTGFCGIGGKLYSTFDGEVLELVNATTQPVAMHFPITKHGWAVGNSGNIRKTSDGGKTWQSQTSPTIYMLTKVYFKDTLNGIAYGGPNSFIKTTDGGDNWSLISFPDLGGSLGNCYFLNNQKGWIVDISGGVHETNDFGSTWTTIDTLPQGTSLVDVYFKDNLNGIAVGMGSINVTTNGGQTWSKTYNTTSTILNVGTANPVTGDYWVAGWGGLLLKSVNSGVTWSPILSNTQKPITYIKFVSATKGYIGTSDGLLTTNDGGQTWLPAYYHVPTNINSLSVKYESAFVGDSGLVFYNNFSNNNISRNVKVNAIHSRPNSARWLVCDSGYIYKSTQQSLAATWQEAYKYQNINLKGVFSTNYSNCWVVGESGTILHTNDVGVTWLQQFSNTSETLSSVYFSDSSSGIIIGNNGVILKTADGGNNWTTIQTTINENLNKVIFVNSQVGWIVGDNGTIIKTNDAGNTWAIQNSTVSGNINSIDMLDENVGYAVGNNGLILSTNNSGNTWNIEPSPVANKLNDISIANSEYIRICGDNGTILKLDAAPATIPLYNLSGNIYSDLTQQLILDGVDLFLYKYDTLDFTILSPITSVPVATNGSYNFSNVEPGYYAILAMPDTLINPDLVPTFYGNSFEWFNAEMINVNFNNKPNLDITLFEASQNSGAYTINGTAIFNQNIDNEIYVNGSSRSSIPASNQLLVLYDRANNKPIRKTRTSFDGTFSFYIPDEGNYGIHLDIIGVDIDTNFIIPLSPLQSQLNDLFVLIDDSIIEFTISTSTEIIEENGSELAIYPNPVIKGNTIIVDFNSIDTSKISLFDIYGRVHYENSFTKNHKVDISSFESGLYFISVITKSKNTFIKRVLVTH